MRLRAVHVLAVISVGGLLAAASPRSPIQAFNQIQPGSWVLRSLDKSEPPRKLCLASADDLIQLRHPGASCSRFVLANAAESATVHYTCPGAGYGRTTVTVETGDLIQLESQGLVGGAPFEIKMEGRRVGTCGQDGPVR